MEELIKRVCVLILLSDVEDSAPSYIQEKWKVQDRDLMGAIQSLDMVNMRRLRQWMRNWQIDCPEADSILNEYGV